MKTKLELLSLSILTICFMGCSSSGNREIANETTGNSVPETETSTKKHISELTYWDVVDLVYGEDGERIEWHGEEIPNTLAGSIAFSEGGACGENDCGKALLITNSDNTTSIEVIVKAAFDIEGDIGYMAWKHRLAPGETQSMGCSHLCYNGKGYLFDRQVVGSVKIVAQTNG